MKLTDLGHTNSSHSMAQVLESQFGRKLAVASLDPARARTMLQQVTKTIKEYRNQPDFHRSQNSPAYLKAVMLEQALQHRISEEMVDVDKLAAVIAAQGQKPDPVTQKAAEKIIMATGMKNTGLSEQDCDEDAVMELMAMAEEDMAEGDVVTVRDIQDRVNEVAERDGGAMHLRVYPQKERRVAVKRIAESKKYQVRKTLREASEVETAQVVLAAQDMADRMQKMIEQTSEMLYKELPALTDSIKYELSTEKAQAFNQTAAAGLQGLLESLQASKGQMDTALAGLTGQATGAELAPPAGDIAATDIGAEAGAELGAEAGAAAGDELAAVDMPPSEEDISADLGSDQALGRARK